MLSPKFISLWITIVSMITVSAVSNSARADLNCDLQNLYDPNGVTEILSVAHPRLMVTTDSTGITVQVGTKVWATESGSQIEQSSWGAYRIWLRGPGVSSKPTALEIIPPVAQGPLQSPYAVIYKRSGKRGLKIADFNCH